MLCSFEVSSELHSETINTRSTGYSPIPPASIGNALHYRPTTLHANAIGVQTSNYTQNPSNSPPSIPLGASFQYLTPSSLLLSSKQDTSQTTLWGIPLKYLSLLTLAVQNASLTIFMHYSRVSVAPSETYSAGAAVLLVELLKGTISLIIALTRVDSVPGANGIIETAVPFKGRKRSNSIPPSSSLLKKWFRSPDISLWTLRGAKLRREIFSHDCWKLSIPAILYVIQNNLQFVAASNLDVATFQVTYQMKILTTAGFSVLMLSKRLTPLKWLALLGLAVGVGIVQIQSGKPLPPPVRFAADTLAAMNESDEKIAQIHEAAMNPLKGFMAVSAACLTSGLAGVYFEMVLKGSKADLWVRNVQLSLFSILPAIAPILFGPSSSSSWSLFGMFRNFGLWAWATVFVQVLGGLITAIVIKYSDNILKGFATSLSIVISFLASVALFDFQLTPSFVIGASTVLAATATYNISDHSQSSTSAGNGSEIVRGSMLGEALGFKRGTGATGTPMSPASPNAPILGHSLYKDKKNSFSSLRGLAASIGISTSESNASIEDGDYGEANSPPRPPSNGFLSPSSPPNSGHYSSPPSRTSSNASFYASSPSLPPYQYSASATSSPYASRPSSALDVSHLSAMPDPSLSHPISLANVTHQDDQNEVREPDTIAVSSNRPGRRVI